MDVVEGVVDEVEESSSSPIYAEQKIRVHKRKMIKLLLVGSLMLSSEREKEKNDNNINNKKSSIIPYTQL